MRNKSYFSSIHPPTLSSFSSLRIQGSLFSVEFFQQLLGTCLEGGTAETYSFASEESLFSEIRHAWNRLQILWKEQDTLHVSNTSLKTLEDAWLWPLFSELGYSGMSPHPTFCGNVYFWDSNPILFLPYKNEISPENKSPFHPHHWLQNQINHTEIPTWGIISNGRTLRLLHPSVTLTRESYLEFDLVSLMNPQRFSDFCVFWLMCHSSRFNRDLHQRICLEQWFRTSQTQHILPQLRQQFREVLLILGRGFLKHSENQSLRNKLQTKQLEPTGFYQQLLQLFLRFLFLLIAEDREQLLDKNASLQSRQKYWDFYSIRYLQKLTQQSFSPSVVLWENMMILFNSLASEKGFADLGLPALGGKFWSAVLTPDLHLSFLSNEDLLKAIQTLSFWSHSQESRIDYASLGIEILGNLNESFLELHPILEAGDSFDLEIGEEVSYYPPTVINHLLNTVLDPALESALARKNSEETILQFKVCDPACGSGYFLIAAAHRLAKRLTAYRAEPSSSQQIQGCLRKVISHCLYGVDINPLSIHLCQFNLLLESLETGKPLPFLGHHIQCGNSLVGANPVLLKRGIPDEAFRPQLGDSVALCEEYQNKNQQERSEMLSCLSSPPPAEYLKNLGLYFEEIEKLPEETFTEVMEKQQRFEDITRSHSYLYRRIWADAWCAVFVWRKNEQSPPLITEGVFHQLETDPYSLTLEMMNEIRRLALQYKFFHWHLAFPHIFKIPGESTQSYNEQTGWSGGFDVVLSAPPWEYTPSSSTECASVQSHLVSSSVPDQTGSYAGENQSVYHFIRSSNRYPRFQKKEFLPVEIFLENSQLLSTRHGRVGFLLTPYEEERLSQVPQKLPPESVADLFSSKEKNKPQVFFRTFPEKPKKEPPSS
ncbi:MAG: N-6 DNA methylase [Planctomycetota bacterium]